MMEGEGVQYGIDLRPRPDQAQRATFRQWIQVALQNTREQRPGIDLNDAIYFESKLNNGADLNELEKELEYAIEKNKQVSQQNSQAMIQQQAQANAQAEQSKAQGQMAIDKNVADGKAQAEALRGNIKDSLLTKEYNMQFLQSLREAADAESGITTNTDGK
jgi:regulator of protease activity HflC (stomatin/prohibitin superfamily)